MLRRSPASSPGAECGGRTSMMSSVIAMAKTPSLKASARLVGIAAIVGSARPTSPDLLPAVVVDEAGRLGVQLRAGNAHGEDHECRRDEQCAGTRQSGPYRRSARFAYAEVHEEPPRLRQDPCQQDGADDPLGAIGEIGLGVQIQEVHQ